MTFMNLRDLFYLLYKLVSIRLCKDMEHLKFNECQGMHVDSQCCHLKYVLDEMICPNDLVVF